MRARVCVCVCVCACVRVEVPGVVGAESQSSVEPLDLWPSGAINNSPAPAAYLTLIPQIVGKKTDGSTRLNANHFFL